MSITMTTLPHLFFASELLEALALLPAPAEHVNESSGWGATEWTAVAAIISAIATSIIAVIAIFARSEWESNTKKQARYEIVKFIADRVAFEVAHLPRHLKIIAGQLNHPKANPEDSEKYVHQASLILAEAHQFIHGRIIASGIEEDRIPGASQIRKSSIRMIGVTSLIHAGGANQTDKKFINAFIDAIEHLIGELYEIYRAPIS